MFSQILIIAEYFYGLQNVSVATRAALRSCKADFTPQIKLMHWCEIQYDIVTTSGSSLELSFRWSELMSCSIIILFCRSRRSDRLSWAYVPWRRSPNPSPWLRSWSAFVSSTTSTWSFSQRRWSWRNRWRTGPSATASSPSTPKVKITIKLKTSCCVRGHGDREAAWHFTVQSHWPHQPKLEWPVANDHYACVLYISQVNLIKLLAWTLSQYPTIASYFEPQSTWKLTNCASDLNW